MKAVSFHRGNPSHVGRRRIRGKRPDASGEGSRQLREPTVAGVAADASPRGADRGSILGVTASPGVPALDGVALFGPQCCRPKSRRIPAEEATPRRAF